MVRFAELISRCDIDPFQQVGAPDLFPVLLRELIVDEVFSAGVGQHVFSGLVPELCGLGEALSQRGGQVIQSAEDLACVLLGEHRAPRSSRQQSALTPMATTTAREQTCRDLPSLPWR
jgi:hypothetical protein